MPAVQTTYNEVQAIGRAGARANEEPVRLISRTVQTAAGIPFGRVVAQGTAGDKTCRVTAAGMTAAALLGITMMDRSARPESPDMFAQYESALVMSKGVIWVTVATAVAAGDPVFVTLANGDFRAAATATAGAEVQLPNARFDTSSAAGGLAQVRLS